MENPDSGGRKLIVTVVCFAVPLLAFFAALNGYQVSAANAERFPDTYGTARAELRLAPVIAQLPATARMGYLTDLEPANPAYAAAFLAAQYALAPRRLTIAGKGANPEWAVGNFSQPLDFSATGAAHGYEMVADFGNGVVLYRRRSSP
jgi:hypothetical protein